MKEATLHFLSRPQCPKQVSLLRLSSDLVLILSLVVQPQTVVGVPQKSAFARLEDRPEVNVGLKRKLDQNILEPRLREAEARSSDDAVLVKKKRYVLVRTKPNGTQDRTYISPDDPILKKVRSHQ